MRVREFSRCVCDGRHKRGVWVARRQRGMRAGPGTKNPELHHPATSCVTQPAPSPRGAPANSWSLRRQPALSASKGIFAMRNWLIEKCPTVAAPIVQPSGVHNGQKRDDIVDGRIHLVGSNSPSLYFSTTGR
jgi:hypothetical protein